MRDLPWGQFRTTVVIELYRVRCPICGLKIEKVEQLSSKRLAPNASKRLGKGLRGYLKRWTLQLRWQPYRRLRGWLTCWWTIRRAS